MVKNMRLVMLGAFLTMDAGCARMVSTSDDSGRSDSVAEQGLADISVTDGTSISDIPVTDGVSDIPVTDGASVSDIPVADGASVSDIALTDGASTPDLPTTTLLTDEFTSSALPGWKLVGTPKPTQISTLHGRTGIFDNSGDGSYASVAVSEELYDCSGGCTLVSDVYLEFSNLDGCWAMVTIGLTSAAYSGGNGYPSQAGDWPGGISLGMSAEGSACWVTAEEKQRHAWFRAGILADDATTEYTWLTISADSHVNKWTELRIVIHADRIASFYADGTLIWQSTKRVDPSVLSGRNLRLGSRSSGSAGKAYHDNIRLLQ